MIQERISLIQSIFSEAKILGANSVPNLTNKLENLDPLYVSVGFEGASMGIAINDLSEGASLNSWLAFYRQNKLKHGSQLCVGLGWACGEKKMNPTLLFEHFEPHEQVRILDGLGYYSCLFNRRLTLRNQQYPFGFSDENSQCFDQGLGRCLWYLSNGNCEMLNRFLLLFPASRKPDLWRGIGVALAYVGEIDQESVNDVRLEADENLHYLEAGVALALWGRMKSSTLTDEFRKIGAVFFNDIDNLMAVIKDAENQTFARQSVYFDTLIRIILPFSRA